MKIRKRKFSYKTYRSSMVIVYHPEKTAEELYRGIQRIDPELKEYVTFDSWEGIQACTLTPTVSQKVYMVIGKGSDVTTLAHECVHVVSNFFSRIDARHKDETDENYAYTLDCVFEDAYDYILRYAGEHLNAFLRLPTPK